MHKIVKTMATSAIVLGCLSSLTTAAAPRDAGKDSGAMLKLQAMVKGLAGERDAAKAEIAKLTEELEKLKKENSAALAAADAAKQQLGSELNAQKNSNMEAKDRYDKTYAKLLEVIEKYKEVTQAKNQLNSELNAVTGKLQTTEQQLATCGEHNIKLYQAGKELMDRYQNKGTFGSWLQDEPILQFNSVEMENLIQDYEDKLIAGQYRKSANSTGIK